MKYNDYFRLNESQESIIIISSGGLDGSWPTPTLNSSIASYWSNLQTTQRWIFHRPATHLRFHFSLAICRSRRHKYFFNLSPCAEKNREEWEVDQRKDQSTNPFRYLNTNTDLNMVDDKWCFHLFKMQLKNLT